jgi:Nucleotide-sugar transporter
LLLNHNIQRNATQRNATSNATQRNAMSDHEGESAELHEVAVANTEGNPLIPPSSGAKLRGKRAPGSPPSGGAKKGSKKKASSSEDDATSKLIKYSALFLLVAQMVGLVLLMRYSRTLSREPGQPLYLASTAVFIMEIMKFVICCVVIAYQSGGDLLGELHLHVIQAPEEVAKLCVPSLLYCVQNNLLYLALTNLDAATYQVCYQLKILTTALFSAVLLQVSTRMFVRPRPLCICSRLIHALSWSSFTREPFRLLNGYRLLS